MKLKNTTLGALALTLGLGACAAEVPKSLVQTPEIQYKTDKVTTAVSNIPAWYKKMPEEKNAIFTVGAGVAPDLQLAVDIATLNGKIVLADRINGKLKAMTKSWMAKFGQSDVDARVMSEIEKVAKNVIADVDVAGYSPIEVEIVASGTQYRAFVLLKYSDAEASKIIMNRLRKDQMVYSRIRSTKAWKELNEEVNKSKDEDEAATIKNIEDLLSPDKKVTIEKKVLKDAKPAV